MLRFIYTLFIGLLIAAFVGVGIDAFYPAPTPPDYPEVRSVPDKGVTEEIDEETLQEQKEYEDKYEQYMEQEKLYNRNVSIIAMIAAIVILVASLALASSAEILADGMILGGVLTLAYAIVRGFGAGDAKFRFLTITVGLVVALILGYFKFLRNQTREHTL